jgi:hypothetical protein
MRPVVLEAGAHFRSGELSGGDDGDHVVLNLNRNRGSDF